jgi:hypothetical protein
MSETLGGLVRDIRNTVGAMGGGVPPYDCEQYAYDGAGNVETITYRSGGASGTIVATKTFAYDGGGRVIEVLRS